MIASLGDNIHQSRRNNRVFVEGRMVKYPIENDLASLDLESRTRCLLDYLFNDHARLAENPSNLDEWFVGNFGEGMTDLYFRPYNEKIWNVALRDLSMSWSERIPSPPPEDVVKGALGVSTEGYLHQLNYHYPLVGGYQAITDAWTRLLPRGFRASRHDRHVLRQGWPMASTSPRVPEPSTSTESFRPLR